MKKKDLFELYTLRTGTVHMKNWGDKDWNIRELSSGAMEKIRLSKGSELEMAIIAIINGVIDEDGKRIFSDSDKKDFLDMSPEDLLKVSSAIFELITAGKGLELLSVPEQFQIELSLKLGIIPSELKEALTQREYDAFYNFYLHYGFGERGASMRSANQIITIMSYITAAAGGKPRSVDIENIYPQLSFQPKKRRPGNNLVDWDNIPERLRQQFIAGGMFTEDGDPIPQNPHGGRNANRPK